MVDAVRYGIELAKARGCLLESTQFAGLRDFGHDLKEGAVLTSVSEIPLEMSYRCSRCAATFWFENLAWRSGSATQWRLVEESRQRAAVRCRQNAREANAFGTRN
jgi:DNA-directed RNA polymerase subunit RPC12/RpoP